MATSAALRTRKSHEAVSVSTPPPPIPPRLKLKALIERSGTSVSRLAKLLGYSHASGLSNYLQERVQGDRPIPYDVVRRLMPHLRGAGNPPITVEELLAVTDVRDVPKPIERAFVAAVVTDEDGLLQVRYRIEPGVLMRSGVNRSFGAARIGVSKEFPSGAQFVTVLGEEISGVGPAGTQLHCVSPEHFAQNSLVNKRVVFGVSVGPDVIEPVLGTVRKGPDSETTVVVNDAGEVLQGRILGVVIGMYLRVA